MAKTKVALVNVRVFNGDAISEPTTVVIDGDVIGEGTDNAEIVDCGHGVLIPGLIDCHIHLQNEQELHTMAAWGVTTGLSMGDWPPEKLAPLRGRIGMTDIRSPGAPATTPGSIHSKVLPFSREDMVSAPEQAASFVDKRVSEGADYIKIIADVPGPDQAILDALCTAAHERGKLVIAHAATFDPWTMAQSCNADIVTHVPRDKALDEENVNRMVLDGRVAVPTLAMSEAQFKDMTWGTLLRVLPQLLLRLDMIYTVIQSRKNSKGKASYENARGSVAAMHKAGVTVLTGTDAHMEPSLPFEVQHGESLHRELELLVEAGMTNVEALRAATSSAANVFKLHDRGSVEVGKRADLVLLSGNPIENISATRSIQKVWCGGISVLDK